MIICAFGAGAKFYPTQLAIARAIPAPARVCSCHARPTQDAGMTGHNHQTSHSLSCAAPEMAGHSHQPFHNLHSYHTRPSRTQRLRVG